MSSGKEGEDWTEQSLRELIEIDPDKDFKGYKNPETVRQALGNRTVIRHEKKNEGNHNPCYKFDIVRSLF